MKTFKDILGEDWVIQLTIGDMRRIERRAEECQIEIAVTNPADVMTRIQDPFQMADLLFLVCEEEAKTRNISSEEFGKRLAGDVILSAKEEFIFEYTDFFPSERQRERIRALAQTANKIGDEILSETIDQRVSAMERLKEKVLAELEKATKKISFGKEHSQELESLELDGVNLNL